MLMERLLPLREVLKAVPISRRHLYRLEEQGEFPVRIKVGSRRVVWPESEITAWIEKKRAQGAR